MGYTPTTASWTLASASGQAGLGDCCDPQRWLSALDILTKELFDQLGDTGQLLFLLGDGVQRLAVDGIFDLFNPLTWTPANIVRLSTLAGRQVVRTSELLLSPQELRLALQELRNKIEVFVLVRNLNSILGLTGNEFVPLPKLIDKAYSMPPFQALWAVEGVGNYYTGSYWDKFGSPKGLLFEQNAPVPEKSLLMLHAGMGLYFGNYLLGAGSPTLIPGSPPGQFQEVVEQFVRLATENARPGYLGPVIESLGLVTRDFFTEMVDSVDQALRRVAPELIGYYWHGVGRALYFSFRYFLPVLSTVWTGIYREAQTCPERNSATSGLTWALVLVNMLQPEIMEATLKTNIADSPLEEGFANGVQSSIIMRQDTTPGAPFIAQFYQYRPADLQLVQLWDRLIAAPSVVALNQYYPVLKQHDALGEVFRYQNLAKLVQELKNTPSARTAPELSIQDGKSSSKLGTISA